MICRVLQIGNIVSQVSG